MRRKTIKRLIQEWFGDKADAIIPEDYIDEKDPILLRPRVQAKIRKWPNDPMTPLIIGDQ